MEVRPVFCSLVCLQLALTSASSRSIDEFGAPLGRLAPHHQRRDLEKASAADASRASEAIAGELPPTLEDRGASGSRPDDDVPGEQAWRRLATGSADAAPWIDKALGNGSVALPCGTYRIRTPITGLAANGRVLAGAESGCVTLKVTFADGDVIPIARGTSFITIENIIVEADVARTRGAMINVPLGFHTKISNVMITSNGSGIPYDGIVVNAANTLDVDDVEIRGAARYGYYITGHATDISIMRSNVVGTTNAVNIDDASGIWLTNMDLIGSVGVGVLVHPTITAASVNALYAVGVWADSGAGDGWEFGGSGPVTEVHLTGCWAASSGTMNKAISSGSSGVKIDGSGVDGLSIQNTEVLNNGGHGIDIEAGRDISITNTNVRMNSMLSDGLYDGIHIGGSATNIRIENNFLGNGGFVQDVLKAQNHQRYGISIEPSSAAAVITLIGNQALSNNHSGMKTVNNYKPTVDIGNIW